MKQITVIGVEMDLGQARRGVDMGPSALRYAGLNERLRGLGYNLEDTGNIETPVRDTLSGSGLDYLPAVVKTCGAVYEAGRVAIAGGRLPRAAGERAPVRLAVAGAALRSEPCVEPAIPCGRLWRRR